MKGSHLLPLVALAGVALACVALGCGSSASDAMDDLRDACEEQLEAMVEETGNDDIDDDQIEAACLCAVEGVGETVGLHKLVEWAEVHETARDLELDGDTKSVEMDGMRARALMNGKIQQCIRSW